MRIEEKLAILADAAKYDVSCSSSGGTRKNVGKGLGNSHVSGICHSYTEDGRCVSLLKILLTNHCIYDCAFCVSRRSNDIRRAAFKVQEVVDLTLNFYRRNYIEGLFLSSGIFKSADYTMERLLQIVKKLRTEERFHGYIHLKTIPGASEQLVREAGLYADRMSINLELPTEAGLKLLAPEKSHDEVKRPLDWVNKSMIQLNEERRVMRHVPKFVPAGQSTQLVVGASEESDKDILYTADRFYRDYGLKRVYYSGYIPVSKDSRLPGIGSPPPLLRENRLYQTDWLMRFYGFEVSELLDDAHPFLDTAIDPKLSWALRHPQEFPIDVNSADYRMILRVPGIGVGSAQKIVQARKFGKLRFDQLRKIGVALNRARHFIRCPDSVVTMREISPNEIRQHILSAQARRFSPTQLTLF
ncbi:putative DNA modification/repair radical SAM protein [Parapedobacter pyrenivorans]|uniref:DNA modification/repair radical SAM protein n=1 Tax=Parapedobacter pyrenivorans TaxID=1305674 RepID=A0A917M8E3_9SPHI|nr:putative DNA modification/repair radical SAM protein [Parapedobacter pyrenivorans]GGG84325.1 putative DNA modification/repair radical SAM protein [Parapedobacter pyrenivorans]